MKNKHKTKFMRTVMLLLVCVFTSFTAWAETEGDYKYSVIDEGSKTIKITCYTGSGGDLTIPETLGEYTVTAIDGNAFNNDSGKKVTTLTIPATVTVIGFQAFANCSSLKSVSFEGNVETISNAALTFCSNLESVTFKGSVGVFNILVFASCSSLKSVTFEGEVGSIGENVFLYCTSLKSICMLSVTGTPPNLRNAGIPQGCTIYVRGSQYNYTNQKHLYTINPGTNVTVCSTPIVTSSIGTKYYAEGAKVRLDYSGKLSKTGYGPAYKATKTVGGTDVTADVIRESVIDMPAYDVTVTASGVDVWGVDKGADGSQQKPYVITSTIGLDLLAKNVNGTDGFTANDYSGKYFVLGADIEYQHQTAWDDVNSTENNYTPIGTMYDNYLFRYFKGNFDGCGHTVKGIRINNSLKQYNGGLFGVVGKGGTVKHVTVSDIRITNAGEYGSIGGITGENHNGSIIDCHATSDVSLNKQTNTNGTLCGGITGYNDGGTVSGCTSAAIVKGGIYVGGIVGSNQTSNGILKDCIYLGNEVSGNSCVGAVAGDNDFATIINCYYTDGSITGKDLNGNDVTLANGQPVIGENYDVNTAQGSRKGTYSNTGLAHAITLGNGVTLSGTATGYALDGEAIRLTSYATNDVGHALKLETVSGNTTATTYYSTQGAEVPFGYTGNTPAGTTLAYIVKDADGALVSETSPFTMPAKDVTASAGFYMTKVPYIDIDGTGTTTPDGVKVWVLNGKETRLGDDGQDTWYACNTPVSSSNFSQLNYYKQLPIYGNVNLILCDGTAMMVSYKEPGKSAIYGPSATLSIYGQIGGTGRLTSKSALTGIHAANGITINGGEVIAKGTTNGIVAHSGSVTINGGIITAEGSQRAIYGLYVTINGGQVTATGSTSTYNRDIEGSHGIILGWRNTNDFIKSNNYLVNQGKELKTADGKRFVAYTPGANANDPETASGIISGTISDRTTINGKTLRPINGYLVGIKDDSKRINFKKAVSGGSVALTADFTQNNIPYYICEASEKFYFFCDTIGHTVTYTATKISDNSNVTDNVIDGYTLTMPDNDVYVTPAFTDVWDIAGGAKGSEEKPYVITTTTGLDLLAKNVNGSDGYTTNNFSGKYFVLGADIEYQHQTAWDDANSTENNYTPIGTIYNNYLYKYFKGNFDGCGYAVKGIRIYNTSDGYYGLFGLVGEGGTVKHVTVSESRISGKGHVSGIVTLNRGGIVTDCHTTSETSFDAYSTNTADMNGHAGGITSYNAGTISGCTSESLIKGTYLVGGIVGTNTEGIIQDCIYFGGQISGLFGVGAVTGENDKGTVTNCYYTDGSFTGIDIKENKVTLENGNPAIGENYDVNTLTRKEGKGTYSNTGLAHAITLGNGVTLSGTANAYALVGAAIRLTSFTNGTNNYALKLETVSGNTTTTTYYSTQGTEVPFGYTGNTPAGTTLAYIVKDADGAMVSETSPFTMPAKDVTVSAGFYTTKVPYIAIDGTGTTTPDGVKVWVLNGTETTFGISGADTNNKPYETWYISNTAATANNGNGLSYNNEIGLYGAVNLILADNSKMTVTNNANGGCAIRSNVASNTTLAIYGQTAGNGKLTATGNIEGIFAYNGITIHEVEINAKGTVACGILSNGDITIRNSHITAESSGTGIDGDNITFTGSEVKSTGTNTMGINAKKSMTINSGKITAEGNTMGLNATYDITINGGEVNAKGNNVFGINSSQSSVTINGGQITAKGNSSDIVGPGGITLGWTNADDFIKADKYLSNVVKVADGKIFKYTDGSTEEKLYEGDITAFATGGTINNLKLTPYGYGGYCGSTVNNADVKNMTWEIPFGTDGKLSTEMTVDGRGDMADYDSDGAPWKRHSFTVANIEYNVTSIGKNAFKDCQDLNAILVSEVKELDYKSALDDENQWKNKIYAKELTLFATGATNEWMTLCDAIARTLPNGCTAYEVKSVAGGTITLSQMENQKVPAYTPVLIKRNAETQLPNDGYKATYGGTETNSNTNVNNQDGYCWSVAETGNKFLGNLCTKSASIENVINSDNDFSYFSLYGDKFYRIEGDPGINAHRCVLAANKESLVAGGSGVRELRIITDSETSLSEELRVKSEEYDDAWYDLSGYKLEGKPTKGGIYIYKGKKIVMKK